MTAATFARGVAAKTSCRMMAGEGNSGTDKESDGEPRESAEFRTGGGKAVGNPKDGPEGLILKFVRIT